MEPIQTQILNANETLSMPELNLNAYIGYTCARKHPKIKTEI